MIDDKKWEELVETLMNGNHGDFDAEVFRMGKAGVVAFIAWLIPHQGFDEMGANPWRKAWLRVAQIMRG